MPDAHELIPEEIIRRRAYHIWQREGCPDGRADDHWQMARTELAMELTPDYAAAGNPATAGEFAAHSEPVEPLEAVENQGSFPGLADQDEEAQYPERRPARRPG